MNIDKIFALILCCIPLVLFAAIIHFVYTFPISATQFEFHSAMMLCGMTTSLLFAAEYMGLMMLKETSL